MPAGFVSGHRPAGLGGCSSLRCGVRRPLRRPTGPARGLLSLRSAVSPYDFARLMQGATEVKCSAFGDAMIAHMA